MKKDNIITAIKASIEAGAAIMNIYSQDFKIDYKDDTSPLTEADIASNKVIISYLGKTNVPIISEETEQLDYTVRKKWNTCWIVDPLDGTKEFIKRNGEFTVNIAFIEKGIPLFGVIYAPVLNELYYSDETKSSAYKMTHVDVNDFETKLFSEDDVISPSMVSKTSVKIVGSRSHMNEKTNAFINSLKGKYKNVEMISKGSSLKFCLVAEGSADMYPRFAPTMEWDTAAGQAICEAVGLQVIDIATQKSIMYNRENLLNNHFLISK